MCAGVKEQNPDKALMTQERTAQWENDKEIIGRIESQLTEKLGISPIVSNDGTLSYYKLSIMLCKDHNSVNIKPGKIDK